MTARSLRLPDIRGAVASAAVLLTVAIVAAPAAATGGPRWQVLSSAAPTELPSGGEGKIDVLATNSGDGAVNASESPVTITDRLPAGVHAVAVSGFSFSEGHYGEIKCAAGAPVSCTFANASPLAPYGDLELHITVKIDAGTPSGVENEVSVTGGAAPSGAEAPSVTIERPLAIGDSLTPFGVSEYALVPENENGSIDAQAGSHPFQMTATFGLNARLESHFNVPVALAKDLHFNLPPGLVGNPSAVPRCSMADFFSIDNRANRCPADTVVGVASITLAGQGLELGEPYTMPVPLFNLPPAPGEPARFGFLAIFVPVVLDTAIRTGGDYGVTVSSKNINQTVAFLSSRVTFWGVPNDPRHDASRGWACLDPPYGSSVQPCSRPAGASDNAFLTLPTACGGPLQSTVEGDSWAQPASSVSREYIFRDALEQPFGMEGCQRLHFEPSIAVTPDGPAASTPTGLTVGVHVPQQETLAPEGLAQADVKDTAVALPSGVQLSPAAADGLQACSPAQIGFLGVDPQGGRDLFTSGTPSCPEASKVATARIKTPLLPNELTGAVYLAAPQNFVTQPLENPFGSLVAMYLVAEDPISGVLVKLAGKVSPDPVTGQLLASFQDTPQLPFEQLELHFFGGERAPLSSPPLCGLYTTLATFTPWSGNAPAMPSSSFEIKSGPNGAPCSSPRPFAPGFAAGSTNLQAGAFTPFTLTMTRPDADQPLSRIELRMPPGLSGTLSNVKLCGEPQAGEGRCGPESLIGETVVSAGLGGDPYTVTGGRVYLTDSYRGAPYGLSIVNPAAAGPFVLDEGRPVVVRASVYVDPRTAALRIVSDPLPTILDGIPLQIQHVNVTIDREHFTFNPTGCEKTTIDGAVSSSEGATAPVSAPFQVTDCEKLAFKPKFSVSTSGRPSRLRGASLTVKLTYPKAPQGAETNLARVRVELPRQLPSRLKTLQKACAAEQFEANPAGCPAPSIVGHARAITPIIPVSLEGPAYFVSHGGEAFPSLIVVLQGYGVTVDLIGTTSISKTGITSSTFKTVPDVPVGSFELKLPEGRFSALAANGNLCHTKLVMPTSFVAQDGAEIHQSTGIRATDCPPREARHRKHRGRRRRGVVKMRGRSARSPHAPPRRRAPRSAAGRRARAPRRSSDRPG